MFDFINIVFYLLSIGGYGAMAGFTLQLARRGGMSDGPAIACGLGWPFGLGFALSYGISHGVGRSEEERDRARRTSVTERRREQWEQQKHDTNMAELKAREALALEKAVHPTYKAELEQAPGENPVLDRPRRAF